MTTNPGAEGNPEGIPVSEVGTIDPAGAVAVQRASAGLAASTDRDPSPGLVPAVMQTVWAELRPGQQIPLPGSDGTLLVTETAVGNALVAHLDGLPELLVRRCAVRYLAPVDRPENDREADSPATDDRAAGAGAPDGSVTDSSGSDGTLQISMTAAVAYGTATGVLVEEIRSVIAAGAQQLFGLTIGRVDVDIVDVYPTPGTLR